MTRFLSLLRHVVAARHVAPALLTLALLAACGGGGGDSGGTTGPTPPPPTIALSASTASGSVVAGREASTTVSVTRGGGYTGTVTLAAQGVPAGLSASFDAGTLIGATTSSELTLSVATSVAPGSYSVSIVGTGAGVTSASVAYQLTVTAAPAFALSIAPDTLTVAAGATDTARIALTRTGALSSPIALTYSATAGPLFGGIALNFSPDTARGSAVSETVRLAVSVGNAIAPGVYPYTITGRTDALADQSTQLVVKVVPPPPAGALRLSTDQISVVQGSATATVGLVLERAAGVTGPVTFSIDNLPLLVSASFTPNPASGDSAALVLTTTPNSAVGQVLLRIRATVGNSSVVDTLLFTTRAFVPLDFAATPSVQTLVVTAGTSLDMDVAVTRIGGFTGAVSVSLTGAPAGLTGVMVPNPIAGDRGTLTVSAASTVGHAIYPVTLVATGAGAAGTRSAAFSIAVIAPAGGSISWQFCAAARVPSWFAVRSGGTQGPWTRVLPTGAGTFTFSFPSNGQVAYVQTGASGSSLQIYQHRPAEMYQQAALECVDHPARQSVTGTIANVDLTQGMHVAIGGADTSVTGAPTSFALSTVANRTTDLLAARGSYSATAGYSFVIRAILRRNVNPAPGAALPLLDFDGPAWIAFAGSGGYLFETYGDSLRTEMALLTSNGLVGTYYRDRFGLNTERVHWGLPPSAMAASDLHRMTAVAEHATAPRRILRYERGVNQFYESTFGPRLNGVSVVVLGSAPVTASAAGQWSDAYGFDVSTTYRQGTGTSARSMTLTSARTYFGALSTSYNLTLPDFSGVHGFDSAWMLQAGAPVTWEHWVAGLENGVTDAPLAGLIKRSGGMRGTFTP